MEKGTKKCKVCGNEYPYCKTFRKSTVFRWQDVACSQECGLVYLDRIKRSRGEIVDEETDANSTETVVEEVVEPIETIDSPTADEEIATDLIDEILEENEEIDIEDVVSE